MTVGILRSNLKNVDAKVDELLTLINYKPSKKKVFIKPNIVYGAQPGSGKITHPALVRAIIKWFMEHSVYNIIIAEGSAVGHSTKSSFIKSGYLGLKKEFNIEMVDLETCEREYFEWDYGKIALPKLLRTHEYVNMPVMKTHALCRATISMKNQKGLLNNAQKKMFHCMDLNAAIRALAKIAQPNLVVVDGLFCQEGSSIKLFNHAKKLGLILAGTDMIEVDNVCLKVMDIPVSEVKHVPKVNIKTVGEKIRDVKSKFKPAKDVRKLLRTEFYLKGCSGCSVAIEQAIVKLPWHPLKCLKFILNSAFKKRVIVSGRNLPARYEQDHLLLVGNCTSCIGKKLNKCYLKGCPPGPEKIFKEL